MKGLRRLRGRFPMMAGVCPCHLCCHLFFVAMGCLNFGLRRWVLKLAGRHLRGHCIAHPAAQGQQGD
jgi:hypothetical protein